MSDETEANSPPRRQAAIWPPPPDVPPIEPAADSDKGRVEFITRTLHRGIFFLVGGCLMTVVVLLFTEVLPLMLSLPMAFTASLVWAGFALSAIYFCGQSFLLAARASRVSLAAQSGFMVMISVLLVPLSLYGFWSLFLRAL